MHCMGIRRIARQVSVDLASCSQVPHRAACLLSVRDSYFFNETVRTFDEENVMNVESGCVLHLDHCSRSKLSLPGWARSLGNSWFMAKKYVAYPVRRQDRAGNVVRGFIIGLAEFGSFVKFSGGICGGRKLIFTLSGG